MARAGGNPNKCRGDNCNSLAGKDGWCKRHRPTDRNRKLRTHINQRTFGEGYNWAGNRTTEKFGICRDTYPIQDRGV